MRYLFQFLNIALDCVKTKLLYFFENIARVPAIKTVKNVFSGPICGKCGNMKDTIYVGRHYCSECERKELVKFAVEKED